MRGLRATIIAAAALFTSCSSGASTPSPSTTGAVAPFAIVVVDTERRTLSRVDPTGKELVSVSLPGRVEPQLVAVSPSGDAVAAWTESSGAHVLVLWDGRAARQLISTRTERPVGAPLFRGMDEIVVGLSAGADARSTAVSRIVSIGLGAAGEVEEFRAATRALRPIGASRSHIYGVRLSDGPDIAYVAIERGSQKLQELATVSAVSGFGSDPELRVAFGSGAPDGQAVGAITSVWNATTGGVLKQVHTNGLRPAYWSRTKEIVIATPPRGGGATLLALQTGDGTERSLRLPAGLATTGDVAPIGFSPGGEFLLVNVLDRYLVVDTAGRDLGRVQSTFVIPASAVVLGWMK